MFVNNLLWLVLAEWQNRAVLVNAVFKCNATKVQLASYICNWLTGDELPPLAPGTIRLYNMRFCPYAQRSVLYLAKKNIPWVPLRLSEIQAKYNGNTNLESKWWTWIWLTSRNGSLRKILWAKYRRSSTTARLALLIASLHSNLVEWDVKVVYESAVVNEYLDEIFPESSVLPKDPYARAHQKILAERLSPVRLPPSTWWKINLPNLAHYCILRFVPRYSRNAGRRSGHAEKSTC